MKASGRVFKYGDNVDTDVIIPARYLIIIRRDSRPGIICQTWSFSSMISCMARNMCMMGRNPLQRAI